jgi:hypothetical protein
MLSCLLGGYAAFTIVIAACAARVALSNPNQRRRADGYKVLRAVWGTGTTGLAITATVRLYEGGLL